MFICAVPIAMGGAIERSLECKLSRGASSPKSIADVLEFTVSEALKFFAGEAEVCLRLAPLADVGLDYLRLGQPVPTLSGGEAQRLKLAGHLAKTPCANNGAEKERPQRREHRPRDWPCSPRSRRGGGSAVLSMSPPPVCTSMTSPSSCVRFRRLIDAGHSLLVIEHNLEVVRAADWIIDLGPEGGDGGGAIVVRRHPRRGDARIRVAYRPRSRRTESRQRSGNAVHDAEIRVAAPSPSNSAAPEEHNLKSVDVQSRAQ